MKRHQIFLLAEVLCFIIQPREWVANSRLYNSESFYRSSVTSAPALVCSSGASAAPVQWCVVFLICVPHCHVGKVRWSLSLGWNPLLLLQPLKPHPLSSRALMGRHLVLMGLRGAEQGCTVTACFQTLSSPLCLSAVSWAEVTNNIWFLPFPWQSPIYCRLCRCYPRLSLISEEFYGYVQTVDLYYM